MLVTQKNKFVFRLWHTSFHYQIIISKLSVTKTQKINKIIIDFKIFQVLILIQSSKFLYNYKIFKIEMEKVPNLDIFTHRKMRKSNSLSRINHGESSYRPSSTFQSSNSTNMKRSNYYDQALKILNVDSQINYNLRNIEDKQKETVNKINLKRVTKNQQVQKAHVSFSNNPQITVHTPSQEVIQSQQTARFNQNLIHFNTNVENMKPPNVQFSQRTPNFIHQTAPQVIQQVYLPPHQQSNFVFPANPRIIMNNRVPAPVHLQRVVSAQNIHYRDYSQPDKVLSSCKIEPVCNNEEQQRINYLRNTDYKGNQYTFKYQQKNQLKGQLKHKAVTLNPFLLDATYLLDIKQSEKKLPDILLTVNNKQHFKEQQQKKDLIEELIQIKYANQTEVHKILRQLDILIEQFDTNPKAQKTCDQSQFRNSRRLIFEKTH